MESSFPNTIAKKKPRKPYPLPLPPLERFGRFIINQPYCDYVNSKIENWNASNPQYPALEPLSSTTIKNIISTGTSWIEYFSRQQVYASKNN